MEQETEKLDAIGGVTRRQLLGMAGAPLVAALIQGCGGGGGSTAGGGSAGTKSVAVRFTLPNGATAANLKLLTGYSVTTGLGSTSNATVTSGYITSALLIDSTSSKVVMVGMIDPTSGANTIDAANVAATLLFFATGGSQLSTTQRNSLWKLIGSDPSTPIFAAVVKTRLDADIFALDAGDQAIKTGLAAAIKSLNPATLAAAYPALSVPPRSKASSRETRGRAVLAPPPSPAVNTMFDPSNQPSVVNYDDGSNQYYDYVQILHQYVREANYYYFDTGRIDSVGAAIKTRPIQKLAGPVSLTWPTTNSVLSDPYPIPLANATDSLRFADLVFLSPIFDAPTPSAYNFPEFSAYVEEWKALLVQMYQRAAVMIANSLFLEAVGLGGVTFDLAQVKTETDQLKTLGNDVAEAITSAGNGKDVIRSVNGILTACTANLARASQVLTALQPITGSSPINSNDRVLQITKVVQLSQVYDFFGANGGNGRMLREVEYSSNGNSEAVQVIGGKSTAVQYVSTPDSTTYSPGGATIKVKVTSEPSAVNTLRKYHWKLSGAGSASLTDGAGNTGLEFDSTKDSVNFASTGSASGVQSIQVTIFNTEGGTPVFAGKAHTDLNSSAQTPYALLPEINPVSAGSTISLLVGAQGNNNIDFTNLSFVWVVSSLSGGSGFVSGNSTVGTLTTSNNRVSYRAASGVSDGESTDFQVTVRKVDPQTGNFTNLAVLSGKVQIDVGSGCEMVIDTASFPLSDLYNPAVLRDLEGQRINKILTDATGYVFIGTYAPHGGGTGGDFVYAVLHPGSILTVGQQFPIVAGDSSIPSGSVAVDLGIANYGGVGAYGFSCTGTARVQSVRMSGGTVVYAKFLVLLDCTDTTTGRTCKMRLTMGI